MPSITFVGTSPDSPRPAEAEAAGWTVADSIPGPLDSTAQADAWRALSRSPGQAVWVDWAGLTPPDLGSLRRFRVSAPTTRIFVEVPTDLAPPDDGLAQVVGMGITDIVRSSTSVADALARTPTPTYADVAHWQGQVRTFDDPDPVIEKIVKEVVTVEREKIVERKVATSTRPTVIAVAGMLSGVGVTSVAVALARYLAGQGWAVALSEHGAHPSLAARTGDLPGVAVYPHPAPDPTAIAAERTYAYVVADFGSDADWPTLQTRARPDLALWVIPGDSHRQSVDLPMRLGERDPLLGVVGVGPDQAAVAESWSHRTGIPAVPWTPEPAHIRALLAAVLPDAGPGRRWFPRARKAQIVRREPAGPSPESDPIDTRRFGQIGRNPPPPPTIPIVVEARTRRRPLACRLVRWTWRLTTVAVLVSLGTWLTVIVGSTGLIPGHPAWLATAAHLHAVEWSWLLARWPGLAQWIGPATIAPAGHSLAPIPGVPL